MDIYTEIMAIATGRRRHAFLMILLILALSLPSNDSFSIGSSPWVLPLTSTNSCSDLFGTEGIHRKHLSTLVLLSSPSSVEDGDNTSKHDDAIDLDQKRLAPAFRIAKIASAMAWITTSYIALSFHPDPRFKDCTLRHNLLTMSQAYAFPLPVLWASLDALRISAKHDMLQSTTARHLGLAVSVASFWLAASMAFPPLFAFGYDLYGTSHKVVTAIVHAITGLFTLGVLLRISAPDQMFREVFDSLWKLGPKKSKSDPNGFEKNSSLLATGSTGLLWFTVLPIVSPYPLATVPTILGKRLSRPASAFTLLGSVMAFCLKEGTDSASSTAASARSKSTKNNLEYQDRIRRILSRGLAIGSGSHLLLIALKLIGVDGGGLIFPGRGLWEVYPAMISVPFATGASILIHLVLCYATCSFG